MTEKETPENREQTISVTISAPNPAWTLTIEEVWLHDEEMWVITRVKRKEGVIAAQVITDIEDSVTIEAPDYPRTFFIYGKTWNWENETGPSIQFIENLSLLKQQLQDAKRVYAIKKRKE